MPMLPKEKEELFVLLRAYHELPDIAEPATAEMEICVRDLERVKDGIVSMMLGLVRNRAKFKDWIPELKDLNTKVISAPTHSDAERKARKFIRDKVEKLYAIVALAHMEQFEVE